MSRQWGEGAAGLTELVRHSRIKVAVAAWAYEHGHRPIMTDTQYDELSKLVDAERAIATGNSRLDNFFRRHFSPDTGIWIHGHPDKAGLENIYARYYQRKKRRRRKRR